MRNFDINPVSKRTLGPLLNRSLIIIAAVIVKTEQKIVHKMTTHILL